MKIDKKKYFYRFRKFFSELIHCNEMRGFLASYAVMRLKTLSHIVESPGSVGVAACVIWPYSVIGSWYTNGFYYSEDFMWQNIVTIITMLSSCVAVKIDYILTALVIFPIGDIYVIISGIVYILRLQSIDRCASLLSCHVLPLITY